MQTIQTQLLVLGGGPGGYAAAFLAADRGFQVTLVDASGKLGGTCLQVGCIPSKALLHVAKLIAEAKDAPHFGVTFGAPKIDLKGVRGHWQKVTETLTKSLAKLAEARKIRFISGRGKFLDAHTVVVDDSTQITFDNAIVATGSIPAMPQAFQIGSKRVMDSTGALALEEIPGSLLVIGGGYIGLEMGTVYASLGSKVTVVEGTDGLIPNADRDLVAPLHKRLEGLFSKILLKHKVSKIEEVGKDIRATLEDPSGKPIIENFHRVLVSVGRRPATRDLGIEKTGIVLDDKGFIPVNAQRRTSVQHIYAIGDSAGEPQLAHKASFEGKVAVEALSGEPVVYDVAAVPAVIFTDPEIAWCGLTETDAQKQGIEVKKLKMPWAGSGRALTKGRTEGLTKLLVDPKTERLLGVGICGVDAGEMIGEAMLALEMGATARDLALTMHAHPTLSETVMEAAEHMYGLSVHSAPAKRG
ncbi:MAG: dihydrolipoyl dehydrogenase [Planctomycetes bacterium]|nr:dihydrolipoyl dehydrogenase [Planctomycetota bacterium]